MKRFDFGLAWVCILLFAVCLIGLYTPDAFAARPTATRTDVLEPVLDTYINKGSAGSSYGSNGNVTFSGSTSNTKRGLLKFTMPTTIISVTSAKINFTSVGGSFSQWTSRAVIKVLTSSWTETATWTNDNTSTTSTTSAGSASAEGEFTLTDYTGNYALEVSGGTNNYDVRSREASDPHPPQLTIVYTRTAPAGDSNLDGRFTSADLVMAYAAGKYESGIPNASWAEGDWNEDGYFDSADIVLAFYEGGYE